jgi:hypothetical protein
VSNFKKYKPPNIKHYKTNITHRIKNSWPKNDKLILVLQCRNCGEYHEIDKELKSYRCICGKNMIFLYVINHLYSKIIYRRKGFELDSLNNFTVYKYG